MTVRAALQAVAAEVGLTNPTDATKPLHGLKLTGTDLEAVVCGGRVGNKRVGGKAVGGRGEGITGRDTGMQLESRVRAVRGCQMFKDGLGGVGGDGKGKETEGGTGKELQSTAGRPGNGRVVVIGVDGKGGGTVDGTDGPQLQSSSGRLVNGSMAGVEVVGVDGTGGRTAGESAKGGQHQDTAYDGGTGRLVSGRVDGVRGVRVDSKERIILGGVGNRATRSQLQGTTGTEGGERDKGGEGGDGEGVGGDGFGSDGGGVRGGEGSGEEGGGGDGGGEGGDKGGGGERGGDGGEGGAGGGGEGVGGVVISCVGGGGGGTPGGLLGGTEAGGEGGGDGRGGEGRVKGFTHGGSGGGVGIGCVGVGGGSTSNPAKEGGVAKAQAHKDVGLDGGRFMVTKLITGSPMDAALGILGFLGVPEEQVHGNRIRNMLTETIQHSPNTGARAHNTPHVTRLIHTL